MPLYEFLCSGCGYKSERLCRRPEEAAECPACGGVARRIFSTFRARGGSSRGGGASSSGACGG